MATYSSDLVNALKEIVFDCNWQNVGKESSFKAMKCYKLYSVDDIDGDILLVKSSKNVFYAIDARCSHEGGPLDQGDIEELGDKLLVVCPWHSFDFDMASGVSSTGLKQETYVTRVVDGDVYINTPNQLSLHKSAGTNDANEAENASSSLDTLAALQLGDNSTEDTLSYWACKILNTPDPNEKAELTNQVAARWLSGELTVTGRAVPPEQPARLKELSIIEPGKIRRGKGGTLASRIALIHSLANIEQWAIDLSWDIIVRFAHVEFPDKTALPREFFDDFVKVAQDEAKHFGLLDKRLKELDSHFGALPVHNGLWESATATKDDLLSRLAIVHMVHEARGLDVHPQTRMRFENQQDHESVHLLDILYKDEITHVAAGIKWFQYSCKKHNHDFITTFHEMVKNYFKGYLKPPFDTHGRQIAGFSEEWYMPLIRPDATK